MLVSQRFCARIRILPAHEAGSALISLKYPTPDVSDLVMLDFLDEYEVEFLSKNLKKNSSAWEKLAVEQLVAANNGLWRHTIKIMPIKFGKLPIIYLWMLWIKC